MKIIERNLVMLLLSFLNKRLFFFSKSELRWLSSPVFMPCRPDRALGDQLIEAMASSNSCPIRHSSALATQLARLICCLCFKAVENDPSSPANFSHIMVFPVNLLLWNICVDFLLPVLCFGGVYYVLHALDFSSNSYSVSKATKLTDWRCLGSQN